jgi:hypothetical protein
MTAKATIPPSPTRPRKQLHRIEIKQKPGRKTGLFVQVGDLAEPIDALFRLKFSSWPGLTWLDPAIYVFLVLQRRRRARHKAGHDELCRGT